MLEKIGIPDSVMSDIHLRHHTFTCSLFVSVLKL